MSDYITRANTLQPGQRSVRCVEPTYGPRRFYPIARRNGVDKGFIVVNCIAIYGYRQQDETFVITSRTNIA